MKYTLTILSIVLLVAVAVYYYVPLVRYMLIPFTGGTEYPSTDRDIFEETTWINSSPLRLSDLKKEGKLILIDFWTYTCINCIRANPHTQELWERYKDYGLVVIGVHSPEFISIESVPKNVELAAERAGLTYPIVLDSSKTIWNAFGNRFWPAKYLISPQGRILYFNFGEGNYDQEEEKIRTELTKAGQVLPVFTQTKSFLNPISRNTTPELYAGLKFIRKPFGKQHLQNNIPVSFTLPSSIKPDLIYLEGTWLGTEDYCLSTSSGSIVLNYEANAPYIVLARESEPVFVEVLLDGKPVAPTIRGADIQEVDGKTLMNIDEARLYYPLSHKTPYGRHTIQFKTPQGIKLFSFTFGAY